MSLSEQTQTGVQSETRPPAGDRDPATVRNGLVGGGVAVLLAVLPLSTVVGGAVAGYLNGSDRRTGTAAGLVAGLVAFVPYTVAGALILLSPATTLPAPISTTSPGVVAAVVAGWSVVYVLALSVLGGLVGAYVRRRRD